MDGWWVICDREFEFVCRASGACDSFGSLPSAYALGYLLPRRWRYTGLPPPCRREKLRPFSYDSNCCKEFCGLDAAGGQVRDEFAVGGEEIVGGEFAGENPGGLLEGAGRDAWLRELCREEMDLKFFGIRVVVVPDGGNFYGLGQGDAEFFAQFPCQRLLKRFAGADFAAGKFPLEWGRVSTAALADEDPAIGTFNNGCYDLEH